MMPPPSFISEMSALDGETTATLLSRVRAGDSLALEVVAARLLPRLKHWATGRLPAWARDLAETQDLVQETIASVLARLREFEPRHEAALTVYLREALANRIRNELRRAIRHPPADGLDAARHLPSVYPSPLESAVTREAVDRYEAALKAVSPEDREAIVGRLELHYSYQELSDAWGVSSADTARKRVERALKRLAMAMRDA
jgi:RNA polymerase sigma factor (sigma-70 family)